MVKTVINLFGGPNTGKSTIATGLFYHLKMMHFNVEFAPEYAKELTFSKRFDILTSDQLYIFAKQHRKMFIMKNDVDYIITDSPLLLSSVYFNPETNMYDEETFHKLIMNTFNRYPNFNIYLRRTDDIPYKQIGRSQTLEQAKEIDDIVLNYLQETHTPFHVVYTKSEGTLDTILNLLKDNNIF